MEGINALPSFFKEQNLPILTYTPKELKKDPKGKNASDVSPAIKELLDMRKEALEQLWEQTDASWIHRESFLHTHFSGHSHEKFQQISDETLRSYQVRWLDLRIRGLIYQRESCFSKLSNICNEIEQHNTQAEKDRIRKSFELETEILRSVTLFTIEYIQKWKALQSEPRVYMWNIALQQPAAVNSNASSVSGNNSNNPMKYSEVPPPIDYVEKMSRDIYNFILENREYHMYLQQIQIDIESPLLLPKASHLYVAKQLNRERNLIIHNAATMPYGVEEDFNLSMDDLYKRIEMMESGEAERIAKETKIGHYNSAEDMEASGHDDNKPRNPILKKKRKNIQLRSPTVEAVVEPSDNTFLTSPRDDSGDGSNTRRAFSALDNTAAKVPPVEASPPVAQRPAPIRSPRAARYLATAPSSQLLDLDGTTVRPSPPKSARRPNIPSLNFQSTTNSLFSVASPRRDPNASSRSGGAVGEANFRFSPRLSITNNKKQVKGSTTTTTTTRNKSNQAIDSPYRSNMTDEQRNTLVSEFEANIHISLPRLLVSQSSGDYNKRHRVYSEPLCTVRHEDLGFDKATMGFTNVALPVEGDEHLNMTGVSAISAAPAPAPTKLNNNDALSLDQVAEVLDHQSRTHQVDMKYTKRVLENRRKQEMPNHRPTGYYTPRYTPKTVPYARKPAFDDLKVPRLSITSAEEMRATNSVTNKSPITSRRSHAVFMSHTTLSGPPNQSHVAAHRKPMTAVGLSARRRAYSSDAADVERIKEAERIILEHALEVERERSLLGASQDNVTSPANNLGSVTKAGSAPSATTPTIMTGSSAPSSRGSFRYLSSNYTNMITAFPNTPSPRPVSSNASNHHSQFGGSTSGPTIVLNHTHNNNNNNTATGSASRTNSRSNSSMDNSSHITVATTTTITRDSRDTSSSSSHRSRSNLSFTSIVQ